MNRMKQESRRAFLATMGKAALVAPVTLLILNAASKPAVAQDASEKTEVDSSRTIFPGR